jgi:hypothetical protein
VRKLPPSKAHVEDDRLSSKLSEYRLHERSRPSRPCSECGCNRACRPTTGHVLRVVLHPALVHQPGNLVAPGWSSTRRRAFGPFWSADGFDVTCRTTVSPALLFRDG